MDSLAVKFFLVSLALELGFYIGFGVVRAMDTLARNGFF